MDASHLKQTADNLAASGAVIIVRNSPVATYLVGDFQWLDGDQVFWFAANGDTAADGHILDFDAADITNGQVRFLKSGSLVGVLSPIDRAEVEDPDDYRVAWSIWQQVAPARRTLMAEARAACLS